VQNLKQKRIFYKFAKYAVLFSALTYSLMSEAVRRKAIDPANAPGFINDALGTANATDKSTQTKNETNNKDNKALAKPVAPPINFKDPSLKQKKKKTAAKKGASTSSQWVPMMGENPDTLDEQLKRKKENEQNELLVQELAELNYNTYIPPKELQHIQPNNFNNMHIPKVYFQSDYLNMIVKAIDKNDFRNLRVLIENYDFINEPHKNGDTILIYAIQNNSLNSARILLGNGAEVDAVNNRNRTALHYAAALGNVEAIRLLLSMGANPLKLDDLNQMPIDYSKLAQQYPAEQILSQYLNSD